MSAIAIATKVNPELRAAQAREKEERGEARPPQRHPEQPDAKSS